MTPQEAVPRRAGAACKTRWNPRSRTSAPTTCRWKTVSRHPGGWRRMKNWSAQGPRTGELVGDWGPGPGSAQVSDHGARKSSPLLSESGALIGMENLGVCRDPRRDGYAIGCLSSISPSHRSTPFISSLLAHRVSWRRPRKTGSAHLWWAVFILLMITLRPRQTVRSDDETKETYQMKFLESLMSSPNILAFLMTDQMQGLDRARLPAR